MKSHFLRFGLIIQMLLIVASGYANQQKQSEFPGRAKYPNVPVISKEELMTRFNDVMIIDARSSLEFETLRINTARNIPIASKDFVDQVKVLRATTNKPIVFYCNGRTCMKSYKAVKTCKLNGIQNTVAYDAGMFEWAKTYPTHASLLGNTPIKHSDIISKEKFKSHSLHPNKFADEIYKLGNRSMVLDVRDKYQRGAAGFFPGQELWASLDDRALLNKYIQQAKKENRALFIYDEVGKQVRWLQYALEQENISQYYFMDKGAKGYFEEMMSEFGIR
jgi:rhodanese-related sulfurtransferase